MKKQWFSILTYIFLVVVALDATAQSKKGSGMSTAELDRYKAQVKELVSYFEGTLNFIGDPNNVAKEKEIIINESYLKIFKDDKVQIEDDLDESREMALHKDVQAYLKDIEFFFRSVRFKFVVSDITYNSNEDGLSYFKVTFNRELKGYTVDGDSVDNKKVRFMEVNLDIGSNDLKIASVYTTKLNEREEIKNWWNGLSTVWRDFFGKDILVYDSIQLSSVYFIADSLILLSDTTAETITDSSANFQIELPPEREVTSSDMDLDSLYVQTGPLYSVLSGLVKQTKVDVSGNEAIRDLEPLAELSELKELNCSNTMVVSLSPLRNLNKLEILDITNTPLDDLSPLQYTTSLKELECGYTLTDDLTSIGGLYRLERLDCSGLRIDDLAFVVELVNLRELFLSGAKIHDLSLISEMNQLEELDVSKTGIRNLDAVAGLSNLRSLNAESTGVMLVDPLKGLEKLELLKISYTGIESLEPLNDLPVLNRIYWDSNGDFSVDKDKKREEALRYMMEHSGSLVIFESEELMNGWAGLEDPWKKIARSIVQISEPPTKEELHALLQIEEITIDSMPITTLRPVASLYKLKKLTVIGMQVEGYEFVGEALELEYLNLSHTSLANIDFAKSLKNLKELNIEGTSVDDLSPMEELGELKTIYADQSGVDESSAVKFRQARPTCTILFKTEALNEWWESMPEAWKTFFTTNNELDSPPGREQLHDLFYLEELKIDGVNDIRTFEPIRQLVNLRIVNLNMLSIGDLQVFANIKHLQELHCSGMPVSDLTPLSGLGELQVLNLENTSVESLKPIESLLELKDLNISGTQMKSLKSLSGLTKLESIQFNNTLVKSISPLFSLPSIQSLSCFNTKVSAKNIEKFKAQKPDCKVVYY